MKNPKKIVAVSGGQRIDSAIEFLTKLCGIQAPIDSNKTPDENIVILDEIEEQFWEKIENDAALFINTMENPPKLGNHKAFIRETGIFGTGIDGKPIEKSERVLYPTSLLTMQGIHPYSVMLIAERINKESLRKAKSKIASDRVKKRHEKDRKARINPTENICKEWASGKYRFKNNLIKHKWKSLGFCTDNAAREALRGQPNPDPWPAKYP